MAVPSGAVLSRSDFALLLDPWYHDFATLGFPTLQRPGIFKPNQRCKQEPLFELIRKAVSLCYDKGTSARGVELFCADGFYANHAIRCGAEAVQAIDLDELDLSKGRLITKILGHEDRVTFEHADVLDLSRTYDFGICAGGLYHLSNPQDLLARLAERIRTALVIQTVYSLANTSEDYFETPAPLWTWGCRFSYTYLQTMIEHCGWSIFEARTNELTGNERLEDRGSAYFLCLRNRTPGEGEE